MVPPPLAPDSKPGREIPKKIMIYQGNYACAVNQIPSSEQLVGVSSVRALVMHGAADRLLRPAPPNTLRQWATTRASSLEHPSALLEIKGFALSTLASPDLRSPHAPGGFVPLMPAG